MGQSRGTYGHSVLCTLLCFPVRVRVCCSGMAEAETVGWTASSAIAAGLEALCGAHAGGLVDRVVLAACFLVQITVWPVFVTSVREGDLDRAMVDAFFIVAFTVSLTSQWVSHDE